jgi:hypothetical protein
MAEVLQFKGVAYIALKMSARLPLARLAVVTWMALVLRPYGIGAIIAGWYRAKKANLLDTRSAAEAIADARARLIGSSRGSRSSPAA